MTNPNVTYSVKKNTDKFDKICEVIFLIGVFVFILMWAVKAPFDASPDESMRFQIAEFIKAHGVLPDGRDPEIRNANWGISYAFNPITTYIIAAGFSKAASFFSDSFFASYLSMRLVNVIFGTLTAFLALRIGKRLFSREAAWFFAALVSFLPGAVFIHSYINMDSIAVFSTAWIVYCWVRAVQEGWTKNVCIQLAAAMSVCLLSYYNAYGYLLCSAVFFAGIMIKCQEKQWDYRQMLRKGLFMLAIVFVLSGWWFIRNAVLYDGDILGMRTSTQFSEMYAVEELKPSNRVTPCTLEMGIYQMMMWIPGGWRYNWLGTVAVSFVGTFGHMDIFMPEIWSKCYLFAMFLGCSGIFVGWQRDFGVAKQKISRTSESDNNGDTITLIIRKEKRWNSENWMRVCLLAAMIIPCCLLIYYAYYSDFQAQGRYIMPALIPLMYFVTLGYDNWTRKFIKWECVRKWIFRVGTVLVIVSSVFVYWKVFAASY